MTARPWMPLYVGDYLRDTMRLSAEESGAYLFLIMEYWQQGGLPQAEDQLARIARVPARRWPAVRDQLRPYFQPGWRHNRVDAELSTPRRKWPFGPPENEIDPRLRGPAWAALRSEVFKRDDFTCTYCGQRGGALECDHMVPVSRGGSNDEINLTTACKPCNRSKRDMTLEEWRSVQ